MAGFDRNQVADIIRNARPTSSESADDHESFVCMDLNTTDFAVIPHEDIGFPMIQEG